MVTSSLWSGAGGSWDQTKHSTRPRHLLTYPSGFWGTLKLRLVLPVFRGYSLHHNLLAIPSQIAKPNAVYSSSSPPGGSDLGVAAFRMATRTTVWIGGGKEKYILPISTCFYITSSLGNFLSTSFGYLPFEGTTTCPFGRRDSSVDIEGLKANVICNQSRVN